MSIIRIIIRVLLIAIGGVYSFAAGLALMLNVLMGPVTPALSLVRAVLWPLWIAGVL
jgi:hypothetical protein